MEELLGTGIVLYVFWKIVKVVIVAMTTPDRDHDMKKDGGIRSMIY